MAAKLLNGKKLAQKIYLKLGDQIKKLKSQGQTLKLVVILVGELSASEIYVKNKKLACQDLEIDCEIRRFNQKTSETEILACIQALNADKSVHGILLQLPLPPQMNSHRIIEAIDPLKDVDGFHSKNLGLLSIGHAQLKACTVSGILQLFEAYDISLEGKDILVIGLSRIVGLPLSLELIVRHATVTCAHKKTINLKQKIQEADIIISATGQRNIIQSEDLNSKQTIIDVGIHYVDGLICGDVDFDTASQVVEAITPVPGGVGPMTICALMQNILIAYELQTTHYSPQSNS
jgi:methylenetetrahydrofolate dehydrogenase (NADP+)/methenyltetrahydrofolate cyclohydrolase